MLPAKSLLLVVFLQLLLVGASYASLETGEDEEHAAEEAISHDLIHEHEERAEAFMIGSSVVFGLSLVLLVPAVAPYVNLGLGALLVAQLVLQFLAYRVGHSGGELVYVHGAASAYVQKQGTSPKPSQHEGSHDHEDGEAHDDD